MRCISPTFVSQSGLFAGTSRGKLGVTADCPSKLPKSPANLIRRVAR